MDFCFSWNMYETLDLGMFCFLILFPYYWKSLSPRFGDDNTDVKTNENFLFLIPFPHKRLCETLQYSHEYGNWNSFKNRYKWTSAKMFLRRFSAAFRAASIKNTHRWFLQSVRLQKICKVSRKSHYDRVLLKLSCPKT